MAKRRAVNHYMVVHPDGRSASGTGPKKYVEALAMAISHPGIGTGRKVCVVRLSSTKPDRPVVSCWHKGVRVKKIKKVR